MGQLWQTPSVLHSQMQHMNLSIIIYHLYDFVCIVSHVLSFGNNQKKMSVLQCWTNSFKAGAALVVSHDRFFLREFATRVLEISEGGLNDYDSWDAYQAKRIQTSILDDFAYCHIRVFHVVFVVI